VSSTAVVLLFLPVHAGLLRYLSVFGKAPPLHKCSAYLDKGAVPHDVADRTLQACSWGAVGMFLRRNFLVWIVQARRWELS
jgi:hypothetical protein